MEPIIWLGILAVLLVIEGLTTALTTIWFAGGALAAHRFRYISHRSDRVHVRCR